MKIKEQSRENMSPKQRFISALNGQKPNRIPVGNPTSVATVESMEICGEYFPFVHLDGQKMAKLASTGYEVLGYDTISPYFSVQQEAAALGCKINWGGIDTMPYMVECPHLEPEDIKIPHDFLDRPSVSSVIKAISILKKEYRGHLCLIGKVMGPWTLSYHVYGLQEFLMDTIQDPDKVRKLLNKLKEVTVLFAKAQIEAGADVVTLADHITGDLVGPYAYRDYLLPLHKELNKRINSPVILHICGKTTDRVHYIAKAGFSAFHFDSKNNLHEIVEKADEEKLLLTGNINNPDVLFGGTPKDVYQSVKEAIKAGVSIISPECAVPVGTPNKNLLAIVNAAREYSFT